MRNRGNGKGGGIAACGLVPEELGVSRKVLDEDYILQVALLDPAARGEVEKAFIEPFFDIDQGGMVPTVDDYRDVPLLEVRPPDVARYFVRVKPDVLARFAEEKGALGAVRAGGRRRVRLPELAAAEHAVLRLAGRQAGLRALARPEPDHSEDRGLCRGGRAVLPHARHAGPRLDRPPALSDQGPRVASRRGASVHRPERGPGPQRRLRQLPLGVRIPGRAQHLPAVPHRHRGLGAAVRSVEPGVPAIRSSTSSRPWRRRPSWTSTGCRRKSSGFIGRFRRPTSTPRPTGRGSSSSPAAWPNRNRSN